MAAEQKTVKVGYFEGFAGCIGVSPSKVDLGAVARILHRNNPAVHLNGLWGEFLTDTAGHSYDKQYY